MSTFASNPNLQLATVPCTQCGWPIASRATTLTHHPAVCNDCAEPTPVEVERFRDLLVSRQFEATEDL